MDVQTAATLADLRQQLDAARKEADFLRGFANNPNVETLRDALTASQAREAAYRTDVVLWKREHTEQGLFLGQWQMAVMLAVPHGTVWDAGNPKAMVQTLVDRERSRADVLAAEVRDARAWHDTDARSTGQMMELASNWDKSRAITDRTNALDPAKFVGGGQ